MNSFGLLTLLKRLLHVMMVLYTSLLDWILDGGYLPQAVIRYGIRQQLRETHQHDRKDVSRRRI